MKNVDRFENLLRNHASVVVFHREDTGTVCPCVTEEGFRDPKWHLDNPTEPVCNEIGLLAVPVEESVKAFVQPIQSTRATRLSAEDLQVLFGEVQADDHLGIFPLEWGGTKLDFRNWSQHGDDYVIYDGQRFSVVNANKLADPGDGLPHHWECGLRLMKTERPV